MACERAGNAVAKAEQSKWADSAGRIRPRARVCGREFFLLDRLQALDWQRLRKAKGRQMAIKEVFGPAEADADDAMEMAPQALGKIDLGDGNDAIVVGGRRIKGLPDRSDEGDRFLAPNGLKGRDRRQDCTARRCEFDSRVFQVARIGLWGSN
jgi:hypothetical protein